MIKLNKHLKGMVIIMKKLMVLISVLLISVLTFSACSSGEKAPESDSTEPAAVAEAAIDEETAKATALEDAGINESAAEDLTVTEGEAKGEAVYVVSFNWSGFDYQYSISKSSGEIVENIFDGEVMD